MPRTRRRGSRPRRRSPEPGGQATAEGHLNAVIGRLTTGTATCHIVTETWGRPVGGCPAQWHREVRWGYRQLMAAPHGRFLLFRIYAGPDNLPPIRLRPMFPSVPGTACPSPWTG